MDYLEFLRKKAEVTTDASNASQAQGAKPNEDVQTPGSLFGEEFATTEKEDGTSVFHLASQEQLENIDFNNVVSKEQPEESNGITSVLRDFFSFESVKKDADADGDGEISAQEAKDYVAKLSEKDGDASTLSMDDFDAVIKEKGIDLEAAAAQFTSEVTNPESEAVTVSDETNTPEVTDATPTPTPTDDYSNYGGGTSYSDYSGSHTPVSTNPLDSMSLEQLEAEKTTRETTLKEKQADVKAVNNGTNDKVKTAKEAKQKAEEEYKNAVKNDPNVKKSTSKDFEKNLKNINENQAKLDENAVKINDKEAEIADQEETIKTLTAESESLTSYYDKYNAQLAKLQESLSKVGTPTGKPEDAENDAQIRAKKAEINGKIAEKNNEIKEKKKEIEAKNKELKAANKKLDDQKKDLEKLNKEKTKLEETKKELNEEKEAIEATIKENCSAETKAKMDAYNNAVKNLETVKSSELTKAQDALKTAQEAVQEVNTRINQIKNRKVPIADLNMDNIPAKYRDQISVKTLPDGTEVLTFAYTNYRDLKPEMQQRIAVFNEVAAEKGYTFVISDGFRSIEESNRARARKGDMVAPGGQSPHNYGSAFDCGVYKNGGQHLSRAEMEDFTREVQRRSDNITWGGDFKSKSYETWHFELSDWKKYKA